MPAGLEAAASGLGAAQGGIVGAIVVMPLEMVVAKRATGDNRCTIQILADVVRSAVTAARAHLTLWDFPQAKRDGLLGLWSRRVIFWKCLFATLNRGLMYSTYSWLQQLARSRWGTLTVLQNICVAYAADVVIKPLVHPIETVVIRLNRSETGLTAGGACLS